ncbi:DUF1292 domain-containing protein [Butyrivibrio sp. MC2013]|uniref:DUF1292 domain-containing protein n=1 Tax=Butyrivibrio sp. MC2013 TaxID=1280686 RepID=UPI00040FC80C|nr:DUF1292 domain-containing protein [Butyrivibrio sp. MC2013]
MEKITLSPDGGKAVDFYALEQTVIGGKTYLLVSESMDGDADALILRDDSSAEDTDALYTIVDDDRELGAVGQIFAKLLSEEGIDIEMEE